MLTLLVSCKLEKSPYILADTISALTSSSMLAFKWILMGGCSCRVKQGNGENFHSIYHMKSSSHKFVFAYDPSWDYVVKKLEVSGNTWQKVAMYFFLSLKYKNTFPTSKHFKPLLKTFFFLFIHSWNNKKTLKRIEKLHIMLLSLSLLVDTTRLAAALLW